MPKTINISLEEEQRGWLDSRREAGGFSSASDVVRSLIREEQRREQQRLATQFRELDRDGSAEPEPESAVLKLVRQVKKERRG